MDEETILASLTKLTLAMNDCNHVCDRILKHHDRFDTRFVYLTQKLEDACEKIGAEREERIAADTNIEKTTAKRFSNMYVSLVGFLSTALTGSWLYIVKLAGKG